MVAAACSALQVLESSLAPTQDTSSVRPVADGSARASSTKDKDAEPRKPELSFEVLVRELGEPVAFDQVFAEIQAVPRFKDEFETTTQFNERQASAFSKCQARYLIGVPVDPEYVRYDADRQVLTVATYALTNTLASRDELSSVFSYGSELIEAGQEVEFDILGSGNVMWAFPREQEDVGKYEGSNAFGAIVTITKQVRIARGVFDRKGKHRESVWTETPAPFVKDSPPVAFEIEAEPEQAKALKQGGLRAAILVAPKAPYFGTGLDTFTPTIRAPYDRTTEVRYLVADIQCAALYDTDGALLTTRATR